MRRTRLVGRQATLWPDWRHFAFVTDLEATAIEIDAFHRAHAMVELAIRDLKEGPASSTSPRGTSTPTRRGSSAPCSPTTSSAGRSSSAHHPEDHLTVARTVRTCIFLSLAASSAISGTPTLRAPLEWPWATVQTSPRPSARPSARPRVAIRAPRPAHRRRSHDGADNQHETQLLGLARPPQTKSSRQAQARPTSDFRLGSPAPIPEVPVGDTPKRSFSAPTWSLFQGTF